MRTSSGKVLAILNLKKGEDTHGKRDKTYVNMIRSFYENTLVQGLPNIYSSIKDKNLSSLRSEINSLIAGANFIYAEKISKMAENFISQLNTNEDLEKKSEMMKDFADIVQQSQELKVEIGKYCNMTFTEDEIDSIQKQLKTTHSNNNSVIKSTIRNEKVLMENEQREPSCQLCSDCIIF